MSLMLAWERSTKPEVRGVQSGDVSISSLVRRSEYRGRRFPTAKLTLLFVPLLAGCRELLPYLGRCEVAQAYGGRLGCNANGRFDSLPSLCVETRSRGEDSYRSHAPARVVEDWRGDGERSRGGDTTIAGYSGSSYGSQFSQEFFPFLVIGQTFKKNDGLVDGQTSQKSLAEGAPMRRQVASSGH